MTEGATHALINRDAFFPRARATVFGGRMTQSQVNGINDLLDANALAYPAGDDLRNLAYKLATAFHETDGTMLPVPEEGKGRGREYGKPINGKIYYGRGYVQLTWLRNYEAMSPVVGVDLVADPEQALDPRIAAKIMFYGMEHGSFTGKKLADYFNDKTDFINARRIINGMDCAAMIAGYARNFLAALGD